MCLDHFFIFFFVAVLSRQTDAQQAAVCAGHGQLLLPVPPGAAAQVLQPQSHRGGAEQPGGDRRRGRGLLRRACPAASADCRAGQSAGSHDGWAAAAHPGGGYNCLQGQEGEGGGGGLGLKRGMIAGMAQRPLIIEVGTTDGTGGGAWTEARDDSRDGSAAAHHRGGYDWWQGQEEGLGLKRGMIVGMAQWPLIIEVGMTVCKGRRGGLD